MNKCELKLIDCKNEIRVKKGGFNKHFNFKYYKLEDIVKSVKRILSEKGVKQEIPKIYVDPSKQTSGNIVLYTYELGFEYEGDRYVFKYDAPMSVGGNDINQNFGKSVTYNVRYGLQILFDLHDESTEPDNPMYFKKEKVESESRVVSAKEIEHLSKHVAGLGYDRKKGLEFIGRWGYKSKTEIKYNDYLEMLGAKK